LGRVLTLLRLLLLPLSCFYWILVWIRNWGYDVGVCKIDTLTKPVISIGNATVGGTGKTSLIIHLARVLNKQNYKIGILSRGYKRSGKEPLLVSSNGKIYCNWSDCGDEPYLIASELNKLKVAVAVATNRFDAGKLILARDDVDLFLLDDGFQHRSLARQLEIICAHHKSFFNSFVLPAGNLRETGNYTKRADLIVDIGKATNEKHFRAIRNISGFHNLMGTPPDLEEFKAFVFCGIGNPNDFIADLKKYGVQVVGFKQFRDHHAYRQQDLDYILSGARSAFANVIITTQKDAVRLKNLDLDPRIAWITTDTILYEIGDWTSFYRKIEATIKKGNPNGLP
jgi:tetraacyldisaccharide 4'-kinase